MADVVGERLRRSAVRARTVQLKLRHADFTTITRARTLSRPTSSAAAIAEVAKAMLDGVDLSAGVRLLGVSVSSLVDAGVQTSEQMVLFADAPCGDDPPRSRPDERRRLAATDAVDAVRARYGTGAVQSGAGLGSGQ